ncbi:unnamed protein product [Allacma fusca]|uniref:Uncharacterized protein n=1 Tax=Allacma fusca TaxID=39272 RepID=A0A8J2L051_9HEXA|nr:unnamed protein product [Allacma fusca]
MDFDTILEDVDSFGTYQRLMLAFVLLPGFVPCGFHAYNQLFMAASPDHWCKNPAFDNTSLSMDHIKNFSIPLEIRDGRLVFSQCYMYDIDITQLITDPDILIKMYDDVGGLNSSYPIVPCKYGWHYDLSTYSSTVVTEVSVFRLSNFCAP